MDARWLRLTSAQKLMRSRAVMKCRKNRMIRLKEWAGGCCKLCGYSRCFRALEFHHINPKKKTFSICADGNTRSWAKLIREAKKCILLCANCHREVEDGLCTIGV